MAPDIISLNTASVVDSIPLNDNHIQDAPAASSSRSTLTTSIPMSLPAILRQNVPGHKARMNKIAANQRNANGLNARERRATGDDQKHRLSKRKQRRYDNAHFHGSKFITQPRPTDFSPLQMNTSHSTFPSPPPSAFYPFKPKSSNPASAISDPTLPSTSTNVFDDSKAADFGRFSLPIKGLKRNTRRIVGTGGAGQEIAMTVDWHLRNWLDHPEIFFMSEAARPLNARRSSFDDLDDRCLLCLEDELGKQATIMQISRQPHSVVWQAEDSFVRFLIHAVARYYRVVSFTKTDPSTSHRFVHLLRPNMASKSLDPFVQLSLETPPTTEWEASSVTSGHVSTSDMGLTTEDDDSTEPSEAELVREGEAETESSEWDLIEGEVTIREGDYIVTSTASEDSVRQAPILRSHGSVRGHILSDIDSGAELEEEGEEDDFSDAGSLSASIEGLQLNEELSRRISARHPTFPIPSPIREGSLSREASPSPTRMYSSARRRLVPQINSMGRAQKGTQGGKSSGWVMPKQTFVEWVMA